MRVRSFWQRPLLSNAPRPQGGLHRSSLDSSRRKMRLRTQQRRGCPAPWKMERGPFPRLTFLAICSLLDLGGWRLSGRLGQEGDEAEEQGGPPKLHAAPGWGCGCGCLQSAWVGQWRAATRAAGLKQLPRGPPSRKPSQTCCRHAKTQSCKGEAWASRSLPPREHPRSTRPAC